MKVKRTFSMVLTGRNTNECNRLLAEVPNKELNREEA
jgi:hypothetical protein